MALGQHAGISVVLDPRGTREGREWARKVIERDGECRMCGHVGSTDNPLQADHIEPVSIRPELALDLNNGQALCRKHNIAKSNKTESKRQNWFDKNWLSSIS